MDLAAHYQGLKRMYAAAPINDFYQPTLEISEGEAVVEVELDECFHHAGGAIHGSVYFKCLDDAAYFAANSLEPNTFVLTASFTTYLTRPVGFGVLRTVGKVVNQTRTQFIAEAIAYDEDGHEVARGNGIFVRGKMPLRDVPGYLEPIKDQ